MKNMSFNQRISILIGTLVFALMVIHFITPIPQDPSYHALADLRSCFGIPNFGDVASNIGFAFVGFWGLSNVLGVREGDIFTDRIDASPYILFFAGVVSVSVGSVYYHVDPNNAGLFWDRLPMTVAFMAFFTALIADRIHGGIAILWTMPVLIGLGVLSLVYWNVTEAQGEGDLRYYGLVQFYPIVALPLILWLFPKGRYTTGSHLLWVVFWYALAKALELFDYEVFALLGGLISGHTLKHIAAAISAVVIVRMLSAYRKQHHFVKTRGDSM